MVTSACVGNDQGRSGERRSVECGASAHGARYRLLAHLGDCLLRVACEPDHPGRRAVTVTTTLSAWAWEAAAMSTAMSTAAPFHTIVFLFFFHFYFPSRREREPKGLRSGAERAHNAT